MRYILCVSFKHIPYKKTCSIQIFSNNCMLDDFELQNKKVHLRYIELDESAIGNDLTFKIYNDDNNYSNGFMTKWAKVKLHHVILLPKILFDVKIMKTIKHRLKLKWRKIIVEEKWKQVDWQNNSKLFSVASSEYQKLNDGLPKLNKQLGKTEIIWPYCRYVYIKSKQYDDVFENYYLRWFGESCQIIMKIIKKHNLLIFVPPSTERLKGYFSVSSLAGVTPYINIYNENKRSHNA